MKKLTLILLLLFCAAGTLRAQELKPDIMSYLRSDGYAPSYDEDGDVQFKVEGYTYYAITRDSGMGYSYVEVRVQFATDQPLDKLITMANDLNRGKYVCKYTAYENDGENVFQFGVEFIASTTAQVNYMMGHVLRLLPSEVNSVIDSL